MKENTRKTVKKISPRRRYPQMSVKVSQAQMRQYRALPRGQRRQLSAILRGKLDGALRALAGATAAAV